MLQWLYTYVANVCFKCFSCFKCMLQVFYLDVAYVAVAIQIVARLCSNKCVSPVSDVFCSKCFMLQVFSLAGGGGPRVRGPRACAAAGVGAQQHARNRARSRYRRATACVVAGVGRQAQQHAGQAQVSVQILASGRPGASHAPTPRG
jgi:hypothetical protein